MKPIINKKSGRDVGTPQPGPKRSFDPSTINPKEFYKGTTNFGVNPKAKKPLSNVMGADAFKPDPFRSGTARVAPNSPAARQKQFNKKQKGGLNSY